MTDRAKLEQSVVRMREMMSKVPAEMKPAFEYLVKKAQEHLDSLPVAPGKGNDAQAAPPAGEKPKP
jgi:hypothetical protein